MLNLDEEFQKSVKIQYGSVCTVINKLSSTPLLYISSPVVRDAHSSVSIILIQSIHRILRLFDLSLLPLACISIKDKHDL
jgi:hypothetical protein